MLQFSRFVITTPLLFHNCQNGRDSCDYQNYLFDLVADPQERTNLWGVAEHAAVQAALVARAQELSAEQGDYGALLPKYFRKHTEKNYDEVFTKFDDFVVPWDCDTIA